MLSFFPGYAKPNQPFCVSSSSTTLLFATSRFLIPSARSGRGAFVFAPEGCPLSAISSTMKTLSPPSLETKRANLAKSFKRDSSKHGPLASNCLKQTNLEKFFLSRVAMNADATKTPISKPRDGAPEALDSVTLEAPSVAGACSSNATAPEAEIAGPSKDSLTKHVVIDMCDSDEEPQSPPREDEDDDDNSPPLLESPKVVETDFSSGPDMADFEIETDNRQGSLSQKTFGTPLTDLLRTPECSAPLGELRPESRSHFIMFRPHIRQGEPPRPFPSKYSDQWDSYHVRMPCSPKNLCPTKSGLQSRWELIVGSLSDNFCSSFDLKEAILYYNPHYKDRWNFRSLHSYFGERLTREESRSLFQTLMPKMIALCLSLPEVCTTPPPLLRKLDAAGNRRLTLTQRQCAALLANAFFCTFPRRNSQHRASEFASFPEINFNRLFDEWNSRGKCEKLRALLHYFERVTDREPTGTITFIRQKVTQTPEWKESEKRIPRLYVSAEGTIEGADGLLQVDFANKYLGGGTLGEGCVQEEIRFLMCPELIVSQLVAEELDGDECLIVIGAERYSNYVGYADTFEWRGNFQDRTRRDAWGRLSTEVVAMDALRFNWSSRQYALKCVKRELNKAYAAFVRPGVDTSNLSAVATGNWGCGAFGGDPYLKSLIQMMAAAETGRDLAYFTFGDVQLARDLHKVHSFLTENDVTVGTLFKFFIEVDSLFGSADVDTGKFSKKNLISFLMEWVEKEMSESQESVSPNLFDDSPLLFGSEEEASGQGMGGLVRNENQETEVKQILENEAVTRETSEGNDGTEETIFETPQTEVITQETVVETQENILEPQDSGT